MSPVTSSPRTPPPETAGAGPATPKELPEANTAGDSLGGLSLVEFLEAQDLSIDPHRVDVAGIALKVSYL